MKYETKPHNLANENLIYEISNGILRQGKREIVLTDVLEIWVNKRFDGYWFAIIRGKVDKIKISSHSAVGFGKGPENKKSDFLDFIASISIESINAKFQIGSNLYATLGYCIYAISFLAVVIVGGALITKGSLGHNVHWGKLVTIPILCFLGYKMVKNGKRRTLGRDDFVKYLGELNK